MHLSVACYPNCLPCREDNVSRKGNGFKIPRYYTLIAFSYMHNA